MSDVPPAPTILNIWDEDDHRCRSHMTMPMGNGIAEWRCWLPNGHPGGWHSYEMRGPKGTYIIQWENK